MFGGLKYYYYLCIIIKKDKYMVSIKNTSITEWKKWIENELSEPVTVAPDVKYLLEAFLELINNVEEDDSKYTKEEMNQSFDAGVLYGNHELPVVNDFDFSKNQELSVFDVWYNLIFKK